MTRYWGLVACLLVALAGCDETSVMDAAAGQDGGAIDAGVSSDAGRGRDAGRTDAGGTDAGGTDAGGTDTQTAGLFITRAELERARGRAASGAEDFQAQGRAVASRAAAAREAVADPFTMADITQIRFGWCGNRAGDDVDDTLGEATEGFMRDSDRMRSMALHYALTSDASSGDAAVSMMRTWADEHTEVNLHDLGVDFAGAGLDDQTEGYCSDRPWNFALDAMWQAYGLMNASDAYLLLVRNGYSLSDDDRTALRAWIRRVAEAVNASHQAWTRWADAHPSSSSFERYRSDNHLSWAMTGLISAAAALDDEALAAYVISGGSFRDRGGDYANPSSIREVIDLAIEPDGRIYEERILRDPPVGYSLFHLWAMAVVARVAEVHFDQTGDDSLWTYTGSDGAGLRDAFRRYAGYIEGTLDSPEPSQEGERGEYRWLWEFAAAAYGDPADRALLDAGSRQTWILQSVGPVALMIGPD
ncbi:MAG: alginate lyase family protein [Sandaracinaceae bacterium]